MATRSLVASDSFTRADGPIGADWAYIREIAWTASPPQVLTNRLVGSATGSHYQVARWIGAGSFSDDQYAQIYIDNIVNSSNSYRAGVVVRCSGDTDTAADYYAWNVHSVGSSTKSNELIKVVNGTETVLFSTPQAWVDGDSLALEVEGTTLRAYRNGSVVATVTDSDLATGKPGVLAAGNSGSSFRITAYNWTAGDLVTPPADASGNVTADSGSVGGGASSGASDASGNATADSGTVGGSAGVAPGTITSEPLYDNAGNLKASVSLNYAAVYHPTTGALVVRKTGLSTNGAGVYSFSDAAIVQGIDYRHDWETADGTRCMPQKAAV